MLLWGQSTLPPSTPCGVCMWGQGVALKGLLLCPAFVYKSYSMPGSRGYPCCMLGDPVARCPGQNAVEAQKSAFSQQLPPG